MAKSENEKEHMQRLLTAKTEECTRLSQEKGHLEEKVVQTRREARQTKASNERDMRLEAMMKEKAELEKVLFASKSQCTLGLIYVV